MAATIRGAATQPAAQAGTKPTQLEIVAREKVFDMPAGVFFVSAFRDGERFLTTMPLTSEGADGPAVIHVILNAHERLKQIAPVPED